MNEKIPYFIIPQIVKVRKFSINQDKLVECLRKHKNHSNDELARMLNLPVTKVEHWFRKDIFFAIPDEDIWYRLKDILGIQTDEFDKGITEFEYREGVYDKNERCYMTDGIAPTLTTSCENEKFIIGI